MATAELEDFLAGIPLFAELDAAAVADVARATEPFAFAAGECLFRQDDTSDGAYLIAGGEVALTARTPGDGEMELARVGAGELIGEFSLLDGGRRSAEANALAATAGYRLDLARFGALKAGESPAALVVLERLRKAVARRTRTTIETIAASLDRLAVPRRATALAAPQGERPSGDSAAMLGTFPGFDQFSQAAWAWFEDVATKTTAPRGTRFEVPGKPVSGLHIVARGALRAALPAGDGVEQLLIHGPGSLAGGAGLVDGGDWPLALDAREDAIVYAIAAGDVAALPAALLDLLGVQLTRDLRRISRVRARREIQLEEQA